MDANLQELSAEACFIADGCFTFAASGIDDLKAGVPVAVHLKARSRGPADHWCYYGGRVYHDFAGMVLHKPKLGIDYAHQHLIGFCEQPEITQFGLELDGAFVPDGTDDDWAVEILRRAKGGVPYELSINTYGPLSVEIVDDGFEAQVNGGTVFGPCAIVRKWHLRGVAVCPYGTDMHTSSQFSAREKVRVDFVKGAVVTPPADGAFMSTPATNSTPAAPAVDTTTTTTTPATPPVENPATPAVEPATTTSTPEATPAAPPVATAEEVVPTTQTEFMAQLDRYTTEFGPDRGVEYLKLGVEFSAAQQIDKRFKAHEAKEQQLHTQLSGAAAAATEGAGLDEADAGNFSVAPANGQKADPPCKFRFAQG